MVSDVIRIISEPESKTWYRLRLITESTRFWFYGKALSILGWMDHDTDTILHTSFEWICPLSSCKPNHHTPIDGEPKNKQNMKNRYQSLKSPLENRECNNTPTKKPKKSKIKRKYKEKIPKENLLAHLPKISSKEYIGKDICKFCNKTVAKNQKAVSCDNCIRWTHLKCSDMSLNTFNGNTSKDFPWVCNTCRTTETPVNNKIDLKKLQPEELPISNYELLKSEHKGLLILHYNCRSILNKIEDLYNIIKILNPSIICLTETWLDSSTKDNAYIPDGYKMIRRDRSDKFKQKYVKSDGGGIAVLYKKELTVQKLNINDDTEESLWVEVKADPNFIIGTVYRANYTELLTGNENGSTLELQLDAATTKNSRVIVVGDLNCDTANEKPNNATNALNEVFSTLSMKQYISKPTRIDLETNRTTTIDHVWANPELNMIKASGTIEGISDHVGLFVKTNFAKEKFEPHEIRFRSYKNYSEEAFCTDLKREMENAELHSLIDRGKIDKATDLWMKIFGKTADKHAPIITKKVTKKENKVPWFNKELEDLKIEKNKRLQLYRLDGLSTDLMLVKIITNKVTHLKQKLKKAYYGEKLTKYDGNSKKVWNVLKDVTQTGKNTSDTEPQFLDQSVANKFNHFFATVGTVIKKRLNIKTANKAAKVNNQVDEKQFQFKEETPESIIKLIERIKTDVAVGDDDMNAKLLKDAKQVVAEPLSKLINASFKQSKFPSALKKALVKPVHKKDCIEDPSNYRPLSILPVLSKVFERAAANQIVAYLNEHNLLNEIQHAYRKGHSTETCLNEITDFIYEEIDKGNLVGLASLNLSKAFDSIDHDLLIEKLRSLNLGENSLNWCSSYLTGRKQKTKFKKFRSTEEDVTSGVPQGSILGPLLFICFVNDLPESFQNCKIVSYADDTQILVSAKTGKQIKVQLENLLDTAQQWYTRNSLLNNPSKTEVIIFTKRKTKESFEVEITEEGIKKKLKLQKTVKILGVFLDEELNWTRQINEINKKARNATRNLQRVNYLLPFRLKLMLYNSLVATHFNYADTVWGGCNKTNKNKLERTQNCAIKSILGLKRRDSSQEARQTANLLTLEAKRQIHEAVFTKRAMSGKLPTSITQKYQKLTSLKTNRSSERQILAVPKHKTEYYKNSPLYRTVKTWNSVPQNLKNTEVETFKANYQRYLHQDTSK